MNNFSCKELQNIILRRFKKVRLKEEDPKAIQNSGTKVPGLIILNYHGLAL
jgi:hypothetical protein